MIAQEMFEELGYKKVYNSLFTVEYLNEGNGKNVIDFFETKDKKRCFKGCNVGSVYAGFSISVELMLAIHQQMKELGWLDE